MQCLIVAADGQLHFYATLSLAKYLLSQRFADLQQVGKMLRQRVFGKVELENLRSFAGSVAALLRPMEVLLLYCQCVLQSQGRSATYSNIINTMTPAVAALAVALTDNLAAALMPWTALQQQGQQPCNADQQQHPADTAAALQALQEGSVGPGGAVQRGYAAAAAAACDGTHSGAAAVLPGGDEECRLAFRIIRRWLELAKEMKDRCRCASLC